jgi:hypothetical protein
MDFVLITLGTVGVMVGLLLLLARAYPGSGADILDWKPTRSYEAEVELEMQDIGEMIEAQNERRRRTGREEITEEGIREKVAQEQRELDEWRAQAEERRLRRGH